MMGSALIHLDIPVTKTSSSLLALVQDEVSLLNLLHVFVVVDVKMCVRVY